ncbi:hypothetical protein [Mammaliicoccus vitulinus]|uniref:hypothetical protein n=1 Tax=Mammaliicoccus vitulinus TaxID=71237 RepID=UPI00248B62E8|nr:hypothetical protein [Mammaliicoccus vitulinus]
MATKKITALEGILGEKSKQIGKFQESTGGGTPIPKGEKLKDHPEIERTTQPRDEEGKFTYNSANAKPLKYGPSRGTTVPPFLKDVKITYVRKNKVAVNYNGLIYLVNIKMSPKQFIETCKSYDVEKGFKNLSNVILDRKRGRRAGAEKEAIERDDEGIVNKGGQTYRIKSGKISNVVRDIQNTYRRYKYSAKKDMKGRKYSKKK